ncbi:UNVERIFIED_ORG: signal transduction histidine kinase [Zoogloea ramigera]|uniref:histidine kinase n=1 Tax=Duganella zoogloeoides TaxID=75659 RepID=A0ABZ0XW80_9BURK|nr:ATP-binding protein [Duganella zoogloeoides]WQH04000.1 ATP-binding protein [Duganella zoogloeoides]
MAALPVSSLPATPAHRFIGAGTPMRDLVRAFPWHTTALGAIDGWPASLRTCVGVVLHAAQPMFLYWGDDLVQIYNDAFAPCFGAGKHPEALGQSGPACWAEAWSTVGPQIAHVRRSGEPQVYANQLLPMLRHGRLQDVYWNYSFTPVFDDHDCVAGVLLVCTETTVQVLAERRRHALDLLGRALLACRSEADVAAAIDRCAADHPRDLRSVELLRGEASGTAVSAPDAGLVVIQGAELQLCAELALAFHVSPHLPVDAACRQFLAQFTASVCATLSRLEADRALALAMAESERLHGDLDSTARIKDEFLAMLGHELRNPLAPIVTALKLMKLRGAGAHDGADTGHEQEVIQRQVDHLVRLVDDLLDVSRLARGKVELRKETTPLADILNRAIEMAAPLIEQKQHRLLVDVPTVRWHGDPARLAQVVANLLNNAARYTPHAGHITLATRVRGADLQILVTDDGNGIPASLMPHIFDLFVQGSRKLDRAKGGLGIGLALAHNLVRMHGGTIQAYSGGEGRGSTFTINLPDSVMAEAVPAPVLVPIAAPAPANPGPAASGSVRVLVVDDNQDAADSLAELLGALGYEASVAYDPAQAIAAASVSMPQVAILDIGLPGMDGFELAGRLRAMPHGAQVTLIALSGYGRADDKARSSAAGFNAHLVKPVNLGDLQTALP